VNPHVPELATKSMFEMNHIHPFLRQNIPDGYGLNPHVPEPRIRSIQEELQQHMNEHLTRTNIQDDVQHRKTREHIKEHLVRPIIEEELQQCMIQHVPEPRVPVTIENRLELKKETTKPGPEPGSGSGSGSTSEIQKPKRRRRTKLEMIQAEEQEKPKRKRTKKKDTIKVKDIKQPSNTKQKDQLEPISVPKLEQPILSCMSQLDFQIDPTLHLLPLHHIGNHHYSNYSDIHMNNLTDVELEQFIVY
jgi:hypothetical protein